MFGCTLIWVVHVTSSSHPWVSILHDQPEHLPNCKNYLLFFVGYLYFCRCFLLKIRHISRSINNRNFSKYLFQRTTYLWVSFYGGPYFLFLDNTFINNFYYSCQWLRVFKWHLSLSLSFSLICWHMYSSLYSYWIISLFLVNILNINPSLLFTNFCVVLHSQKSP